MYGIAIITAIVLGSYVVSVWKLRNKRYAEYRKFDHYGPSFPNPIPPSLPFHEREMVKSLESDWRKALIYFAVGVGGTLLWAFGSSTISASQDAKNTVEARSQFVEGYSQGWSLGCEAIFEGTAKTLYYGDNVYTEDWCNDLYVPLESSLVDSFQSVDPSYGYDQGKARGSSRALGTVFDAVPILCSGNLCWDITSFEEEPYP